MTRPLATATTSATSATSSALNGMEPYYYLLAPRNVSVNARFAF